MTPPKTTNQWVKQAFDDYYSTLYDTLVFTFKNLSTQDIEDAISDVFSILLKRDINRLNQIENIYAFLKCSIERKLITRHNKKNNLVPLNNAINYSNTSSNSVITPQYIVNMFKYYIVLSPRSRMIVLLKAQGRSTEQIANFLNLTESCVNTIWHRLVKKIKQKRKAS